MSDNNDPSTEPEGIKNLRAKAAEADTATARAEAAERRLAFVEAGIPLNSKPAQAFLTSYSGEMTPEAIKAEAAEWNLLPAAAGDPPPPANPYGEGSPEHQQQLLRDGLEGGNPAGDEPPPIPAIDTALKNFKKNRENGMGATPAQNLAFGEVIKAAAMGDTSVIFDPQAWAAEQAQHGHGAEFAR